MPSLPHTKTFPGKVRIVDPGPKDATGKTPKLVVKEVLDPRFTHPKTNKKMRNQKVTRVTIPAGFDLQYEIQHKAPGAVPIGRQRPEKPLTLVKVVKDAATATS